MPKFISGLHHVTAISGPAQRNVDFYAGNLQQRLVKKTVNFDAPDVYHLYYGDRTGDAGTILTFFPFGNSGAGKTGWGQTSAVAYEVPKDGLNDWLQQLKDEKVDFSEPNERFGERFVTLRDPDGMVVELIETANNATVDNIGALKDNGFHSVTLWEKEFDKTGRVLTDLFGYEQAGEEKDGEFTRLRFKSPSGERGSIVDLIRKDGAARHVEGAGSIHHVAFRAETYELHEEWREKASAFGMHVTPVIDRQYFNAIYFREPGGVLFEIASNPPGFAVDEPVAELGQNLKLPAQYEKYRAQIEQVLPPLKVPAIGKGK